MVNLARDLRFSQTLFVRRSDRVIETFSVDFKDYSLNAKLKMQNNILIITEKEFEIIYQTYNKEIENIQVNQTKQILPSNIRSIENPLSRQVETSFISMEVNPALMVSIPPSTDIQNENTRSSLSNTLHNTNLIGNISRGLDCGRTDASNLITERSITQNESQIINEGVISNEIPLNVNHNKINAEQITPQRVSVIRKSVNMKIQENTFSEKTKPNPINDAMVNVPQTYITQSVIQMTSNATSSMLDSVEKEKHNGAFSKSTQSNLLNTEENVFPRAATTLQENHSSSIAQNIVLSNIIDSAIENLITKVPSKIVEQRKSVSQNQNTSTVSMLPTRNDASIDQNPIETPNAHPAQLSVTRKSLNDFIVNINTEKEQSLIENSEQTTELLIDEINASLMNDAEEFSQIIESCLNLPSTSASAKLYDITSSTNKSDLNKTQSSIEPPPTPESSEEIQKQIDDVVNIMRYRPNLDMHNIHCPLQNCYEHFNSFDDLNLHIAQHSNPAIINAEMCYICDMKMSNYSLNKRNEHMIAHNNTRFFCMYCSAKATNFHDIVDRHIASQHVNKLNKAPNEKVTRADIKLIPLNPQLKDVNNDAFIVCSKETTDEEAKHFCKRLIERKAKYNNQYRTEFNPDEIHLLPNESIFKFNIKCSLCSYITKVKKNLLNHFCNHKSAVKEEIIIDDDDDEVTVSNDSHNRRNSMLLIDQPQYSDGTEITCQLTINKDDSDSQKTEINEDVSDGYVTAYRRPCPLSKKPRNNLDYDDTSNDEILNDRIYRCIYCNVTGMYTALKEHHNEKHQNQLFKPKIVNVTIPTTSNDTESDSQEKESTSETHKQRPYEFFFCCFSCPKRTTRISTLIKHWKDSHQFRKQGPRPFVFRVSKLVICFYCKEKKLFVDMPSHHIKHHSNKPFLTLNEKRNNMCGECPFTFYDDIPEYKEHYKSCHETDVKKVKPLPEDVIEKKLIEQCINMNTKQMYYCKICCAESDSIEELMDHHDNDHSRIALKQIEPKEKRKSYWCCKEWPLNEEQLIEHFETKHVIRDLTSENLLETISKIRIIFPSGIICGKSEMGDSKHLTFQEIITALKNKFKTGVYNNIEYSDRKRRKSMHQDLKTMEDTITDGSKKKRLSAKLENEENTIENISATKIRLSLSSNSKPLSKNRQSSSSSDHSSHLKHHKSLSSSSGCSKKYKSYYGRKPKDTSYSFIYATGKKANGESYRIPCTKINMYHILKIRPVTVLVEDIKNKIKFIK